MSITYIRVDHFNGGGSNAEPLIAATEDVRSVEEQAKSLMGRIVERGDGMDTLRQRIREETLDEILEIIKPYLQTDIYLAIRHKLHEEI